MNTSLKTLPRIAEILPGAFVTILLAVSYVKSLKNVDVLNFFSNKGSLVLLITAGLAFLVFWIIGTLFDALRNVLEWFWDKWSQINWKFFFKGKLTKVRQLEEYYYAYYTMDANFVIGIIFFFIAELLHSYLPLSPLSALPLWVFFSTGIAFIVFLLDAISFRKEIKTLIDNYEQTATPS